MSIVKRSRIYEAGEETGPITRQVLSALNEQLTTVTGYTTDDITEGANLYYTDERVDDRVDSLLVGGTNVTLTYDDVAGTLTIDSINEGFEGDVEGVVGNMVQGNTETLIDVTYQSGDGTLDFVVQEASIDHDNLTNFLAVEHRAWENSITQNIHADNITEASVTQHEAALTITENQISDLNHFVNIVSNVATDTILGRVTAGSGNSEELTPSQVRTLINVEDGATADQTDEEIQDAVFNNILTGIQTGITVTYDDPNNEVDFVVSLASFDTGDLSEGSNLYYTDERVDDRVAVLLQNGGGLTWTYDDIANTLTPDVDHDALTNFVANEHIDHTSISILTSTGLTGGGTIDSTQTLSLSHLGIEDLTDPNADRIFFWDDSATASKWLGVGNSLSITTTTLDTVQDIRTSASPTFASLTLSGTTEQLRLSYDASNYASFTISSGGNLTVAPTGNYIFDPAGNDVYPNTNYDLDLGQINKKWLTLHAAELWVETLVAQDTMATIGGRVLVGPTTELASDLLDSVYLVDGATNTIYITSGNEAYLLADTTITVKHNEMASGDIVYLESNGKVEFLRIDSAPSGTGPYTYAVTRDLAGTGRQQWYAGDAVFNTGASGDGFIDLYSFSGVDSAGAGPTIVGNVRNSATYNDWTEHWAIGNLNGLYGYGTDTYGIGLGKATSDHLTADPTDGIRLLDGDGNIAAQLSSHIFKIGDGTNYIQYNADTAAADLAMDTFTLSATNISITSASGISLNAGTIDLSLDGSGQLANGAISWDNAGNITTVNKITAGSGTIANWTINTDDITSSSGIITLDQANDQITIDDGVNSMALGNEVAFASTGSGLYLDANNYWFFDWEAGTSNQFNMGGASNYVSWDGTDLNVVGDITATGGSISGSFSVEDTLTIGTGGSISGDNYTFSTHSQISTTGMLIDSSTPEIRIGASFDENIYMTVSNSKGYLKFIDGSVNPDVTHIQMGEGVIQVGETGSQNLELDGTAGTLTFNDGTNDVLFIKNSVDASGNPGIDMQNNGIIRWYGGADNITKISNAYFYLDWDIEDKIYMGSATPSSALMEINSAATSGLSYALNVSSGDVKFANDLIVGDNLSVDNYIDIDLMTAPSAPGAGWRLYVDNATGQLKAKYPSGTTVTLATP